MNYSRNIKKASIGKRVLISWVVVAIIFSLVGFGIGAICSKGGGSPEQTEPETKKEILIFGKPDGKIFEGEMPGEWAVDLKFVPLDVPMDEDLQ